MDFVITKHFLHFIGINIDSINIIEAMGIIIGEKISTILEKYEVNYNSQSNQPLNIFYKLIEDLSTIDTFDDNGNVHVHMPIRYGILCSNFVINKNGNIIETYENKRSFSYFNTYDDNGLLVKSFFYSDIVKMVWITNYEYYDDSTLYKECYFEYKLPSELKIKFSSDIDLDVITRTPLQSSSIKLFDIMGKPISSITVDNTRSTNSTVLSFVKNHYKYEYDGNAIYQEITIDKEGQNGKMYNYYEDGWLISSVGVPETFSHILIHDSLFSVGNFMLMNSIMLNDNKYSASENTFMFKIKNNYSLHDGVYYTSTNKMNSKIFINYKNAIITRDSVSNVTFAFLTELGNIEFDENGNFKSFSHNTENGKIGFFKKDNS